MSEKGRTIHDVLSRHIRTADKERMDGAAARVLRRLRSEPDSEEEREPLREFGAPYAAWRRMAFGSVIAAVTLVIVIAILWRQGGIAVAQAVDGSLYKTVDGKDQPAHEGERIIAGDRVRTERAAGSMLSLNDGSRIEMRAESELSFERADDGLVIHLHSGSVIVNAAKQPAGRHLNVQTKDVTVSVVGTVFLVSAEEEGSRVAVIEGEVHVQNDETAKTIHSGQQFVTTLSMRAIPIEQEISWSRESSVHLASLQQRVVTPNAPNQDNALEFEAVSIKPDTPGTPTAGAVGFACHGSDGVRRALFGESEGELIVPQGRCVGRGNVFMAFVIGFAYGKLSGQHVLGGPDWIRPSPPPRRVAASTFQIEAIVKNPSTATLNELTAMLRAMLADRFKLKAHREFQEGPGYALVIGRDGAKLKESSTNDELSPFPGVNSSGQLVIRGKSTLDKFIQVLGQFIEAPVLDRTGLVGMYDYEFSVREVGSAGGRGGRGPDQRIEPRTPEDRAGEISDLMEGQLGLRLQREKAVPVEMIVVDQIEMPSPN